MTGFQATEGRERNNKDGEKKKIEKRPEIEKRPRKDGEKTHRKKRARTRIRTPDPSAPRLKP